jgi:hypothetical protein
LAGQEPAVVVISSELIEVLGMADRILVLAGGVDLSLGMVVRISAISTAITIGGFEERTLLGIGIALLLGLMAGAVNGHVYAIGGDDQIDHRQRVQPAGRVRLVPAAAQRRDHSARRRRLRRAGGAGAGSTGPRIQQAKG